MTPSCPTRRSSDLESTKPVAELSAVCMTRSTPDHDDETTQHQNLLLESLGLTAESADEMTEAWEQKPFSSSTAMPPISTVQQCDAKATRVPEDSASQPSSEPSPNNADAERRNKLLESLGLTETDASGMVEVWEELAHQCEPGAASHENGNVTEETKLSEAGDASVPGKSGVPEHEEPS